MILNSQFQHYLLGLFAVANTIPAISPFLVLCEKLNQKQRIKATSIVSTAALVIMLMSMFFGLMILDFFSISISAFQIAGGLLLCRSGFSMMQQQESNASPDNTKKNSSINPSKIISTLIVPIAFPLTTGAGTISTITLFADTAKQTQSQPELLAAILCVTLMVFISLYFAFEGLKVLGDIGMNVFTKIMGLFTLAIGVQFLITGVSAVYKNLI
jgi:multiple antibiotic resistance protein